MLLCYSFIEVLDCSNKYILSPLLHLTSNIIFAYTQRECLNYVGMGKLIFFCCCCLFLLFLVYSIASHKLVKDLNSLLLSYDATLLHALQIVKKGS